ncbi:MAG: hypothetical protein KA297_26715 [Kofleriaceae bacterium]|jgi:hypothetical protein|nr:hypothetical protein [Kofleriaceae bacterium]MBP6839882.1 hypothetical protein [Kofleriaceae bacterium]
MIAGDDYRLPGLVRPVVRALAEVVCPPRAAELGLLDDVTRHVAAQIGAIPPLMRRGLEAGLVTYDQGARLYPPARGRAAHRLPADVHARYFATWQHGPTPIHRQLARAIKQLIAMSCYEQPAMLADLGYTPAAWIDQVTRRRLAVYQPAITRAAADVLAPDPLRPGAPAPHPHGHGRRGAN